MLCRATGYSSPSASINGKEAHCFAVEASSKEDGSPPVDVEGGAVTLEIPRPFVSLLKSVCSRSSKAIQLVIPFRVVLHRWQPVLVVAFRPLVALPSSEVHAEEGSLRRSTHPPLGNRERGFGLTPHPSPAKTEFMVKRPHHLLASRPATISPAVAPCCSPRPFSECQKKGKKKKEKC